MFPEAGPSLPDGPRETQSLHLFTSSVRNRIIIIIMSVHIIIYGLRLSIGLSFFPITGRGGVPAHDDITPTNYLLYPYLSADAGPVLLLVLLTSA